MPSDYFNFHYCLWLSPDTQHPWYSYTEGFNPHMTIRYYLNQEEAQIVKRELRNQLKPFEVEIYGDPVVSVDGNFHAIYYHIRPVDANQAPNWFPENAHISFRYGYEKPFTKEEIEEIKNKVIIRKALMNQIKVVCCNGHYHSWKPEHE